MKWKSKLNMVRRRIVTAFSPSKCRIRELKHYLHNTKEESGDRIVETGRERTIQVEKLYRVKNIKCVNLGVGGANSEEKNIIFVY